MHVNALIDFAKAKNCEVIYLFIQPQLVLVLLSKEFSIIEKHRSEYVICPYTVKNIHSLRYTMALVCDPNFL